MITFAEIALKTHPDRELHDDDCDFLMIPRGTTYGELGEVIDECSSDMLKDLKWKPHTGPYTHRRKT